jgi:hypothetical protein
MIHYAPLPSLTYPALRCVMSNFNSSRTSRLRALELLEVGASPAYWMDPGTFQNEVLAIMFNARERDALRLYSDSPDDVFEPKHDGPLMMAILRHLLEHGLDANMTVSIDVNAMQSETHRGRSLRYQGSLLGAVACLLCGRTPDLRLLCVPLVELLLRHGASPYGPGERISGAWQRGFAEVSLQGDWNQTEAHFLETGSVLARLQHQQAQGSDEVDAAVIAVLLA